MKENCLHKAKCPFSCRKFYDSPKNCNELHQVVIKSSQFISKHFLSNLMFFLSIPEVINYTLNTLCFINAERIFPDKHAADKCRNL